MTKIFQCHHDPICSYDVRIEEAADKYMFKYFNPVHFDEDLPPLTSIDKHFINGAKFIIDEYLIGSEIDRKYFEHELVPQLEFKYQQLKNASDKLVEALELIYQRRMSVYLNLSNMAEDQILTAHEALSKYKKDVWNE